MVTYIRMHIIIIELKLTLQRINSYKWVYAYSGMAKVRSQLGNNDRFITLRIAWSMLVIAILVISRKIIIFASAVRTNDEKACSLANKYCVAICTLTISLESGIIIIAQIIVIKCLAMVVVPYGSFYVLVVTRSHFGASRSQCMNSN